jgi:transcriptional regulator GlxA family with amidase domain
MADRDEVTDTRLVSVPRRRVLSVALPDAQLLDIVGPAEVFDAANRLLDERTYELRTASPTGAPVRAGCGLTLQVDAAIHDADETVDTLLVGGGWGFERVGQDARLVAEVARRADRARRVASVCTGAFVLGAAGLLDGRVVTTHWAASRLLADRYPAAHVEPDRIFVRDGRLATAAGVTSGLDLALAFVEEDHGRRLARRVARWLVVFMQRPGGQSQFSEWLAHPVPVGSSLQRLLDEIVTHPGADHSVPRLAERAAVSERHLTRLFIKQMGMTPARLVERIRVEAARQALESEDAGVEVIARRCGFGSPETMRRAFLRILGITPSEHRFRFGPRSHSLGTRPPLQVFSR